MKQKSPEPKFTKRLIVTAPTPLVDAVRRASVDYSNPGAYVRAAIIRQLRADGVSIFEPEPA